jgi:hypothetical protein
MIEAKKHNEQKIRAGADSQFYAVDKQSSYKAKTHRHRIPVALQTSLDFSTKLPKVKEMPTLQKRYRLYFQTFAPNRITTV